jgi:hypothetical protein
VVHTFLSCQSTGGAAATPIIINRAAKRMRMHNSTHTQLARASCINPQTPVRIPVAIARDFEDPDATPKAKNPMLRRVNTNKIKS